MAIIILDWLLAAARSARRALVGRDGSRATWAAMIASLGVVAATAFSAITVLRTPEQLAPVALDPPPDVYVVSTPQVGTPEANATPASRRPAPTRTTATAAPPAPQSAAPAPPSTAAPRTPSALNAAFAVEDSALLSYGAAVTIGNPGPGSVTGWKLVITLPRESLDITDVHGARASRDGATWTLLPDESTGQVPGRGSVQVTFRVDGSSISSTPTACTIDGTDCTGLPD